MTRRITLPFVLVIGSITTACLDKDEDDDEGNEGWEDSGGDDDTDGGTDSDNSGWYSDDDGDGWYGEEGDCDDTNAAINPDAVEDCGDGVDNDCDGLVDGDDDDCYETNAGWYADDDGDGYTDEDDCDDTDAAINPGATEDCEDAVDNDCDGLIDAADTEDCGETEPAGASAAAPRLDWDRLDWCAPEGRLEGLRGWRRAGSPFVVTTD